MGLFKKKSLTDKFDESESKKSEKPQWIVDREKGKELLDEAYKAEAERGKVISDYVDKKVEELKVERPDASEDSLRTFVSDQKLPRSVRKQVNKLDKKSKDLKDKSYDLNKYLPRPDLEFDGYD